MYTHDLMKTTTSWASRPLGGVTHTPNPFAQSQDWGRVALPTLKVMHTMQTVSRSAWIYT